MTLPGKAEMPERPERLLEELLALRDEITGTADTLIARFEAVGARITPEVVNLAHYLVIRHHDLRPLQRALMWRGLSSMGRLESRVLPTLDAIAASLAALCGRVSPHPAPTEAAFFTGEARLEAATDALFGAPPLRRRCRVMVTLPSEAAGDAAFVLGLARAGMDVARINCAHDDAAAWRAMTAHVRAAADAGVGGGAVLGLGLAAGNGDAARAGRPASLRRRQA